MKSNISKNMTKIFTAKNIHLTEIKSLGFKSRPEIKQFARQYKLYPKSSKLNDLQLKEYFNHVGYVKQITKYDEIVNNLLKENEELNVQNDKTEQLIKQVMQTQKTIENNMYNYSTTIICYWKATEADNKKIFMYDGVKYRTGYVGHVNFFTSAIKPYNDKYITTEMEKPYDNLVKLLLDKKLSNFDGTQLFTSTTPDMIVVAKLTKMVKHMKDNYEVADTKLFAEDKNQIIMNKYII